MTTPLPLLVATDLTALSRHAVHRAAMLARQAGAPLDLLRGGVEQHGVQSPALFATGHQPQGHGRELAGFLQCARQSLALAHTHRGARDQARLEPGALDDLLEHAGLERLGDGEHEHPALAR